MSTTDRRSKKAAQQQHEKLKPSWRERFSAGANFEFDKATLSTQIGQSQHNDEKGEENRGEEKENPSRESIRSSSIGSGSPLFDEKSQADNISCHHAIEVQQKLITARTEFLQQHAIPTARNVLYGLEDIPYFDPSKSGITSETFIKTLVYLESSQLFGPRGSDDQPTAAHLALVSNWKAQLQGRPNYTKWHEKFTDLSQRLLARENESHELATRKQDQLDTLTDKLKTHAQRLNSIDNPQALRAAQPEIEKDIQQIIEHCEYDNLRVRLALNIFNVSFNEDDFIEPENVDTALNNILPEMQLVTLGEELDKFDHRLPPLIDGINDRLTHLAELTKALIANPTSDALQQEYGQCMQALNKHLTKLTQIIGQYQQGGYIHTLMQRPNYRKFANRLNTLNRRMQALKQLANGSTHSWASRLTQTLSHIPGIGAFVTDVGKENDIVVQLPSENHFSDLNKKIQIYSTTMSGELRPAAEQRNGPLAEVSRAAFLQALQQYEKGYGVVKQIKRRDGKTTYRFPTAAHKAAFLQSVAAIHAQLDTTKKDKNEQDEKEPISVREASEKPTNTNQDEKECLAKEDEKHENNSTGLSPGLGG